MLLLECHCYFVDAYCFPQQADAPSQVCAADVAGTPTGRPMLNTGMVQDQAEELSDSGVVAEADEPADEQPHEDDEEAEEMSVSGSGSGSESGQDERAAPDEADEPHEPDAQLMSEFAYKVREGYIIAERLQRKVRSIKKGTIIRVIKNGKLDASDALQLQFKIESVPLMS